MATRSIITAFIICTGMLLSGCVTPHTERVVNVNPSGWIAQDTAVIVYPNLDTIGLRNIYISLRLDDRFTKNDLTLSIAAITPDSSLYFSEDFHIELNDLPKANNRYREIEIPYRLNSSFSMDGDYIFKITHKDDAIKGINAIGIATK